MKLPVIFCLPLLLPWTAAAKLIIADTIGREKIVRNLTLGLTPARNVEVKAAKLVDALRELRQGKIQLLLSSYKLDRQQRKQLQVDCYRYALDPTLFVVNSANRLNDLTGAQLGEVLRGETVTWQPLGGDAYAIHLAIAKDDQPGIKSLHRKLLKKAAIKARYFEVSNAKGISVLASCQQGFLGVCGFINLPLAAKALAVNGTAPTIANIRSGKYQPVLEYWIWISVRDKAKNTLKHQAALEFIRLLRDQKTAKFIEGCGLLAGREDTQ
ncbi:MAG: hypothetical protein PHH77_02680 [Victivallaceae bacterium]|nr:hypothetical protein [Victivallaceae bacterium]